tara:strand:+ start:89 stop:277 length:189 start_codon:yes stop_codon:yes gene_type:complete
MRGFFGLSEAYMETVYEQFFLLKYYGGWSFQEAYSLPIGLRKWFLERLTQEIKRRNEEIAKS